MNKVFLVVFLLISTAVFSKKTVASAQPDSLKKMTFEILDKKFSENIRNPKKSAYAAAYYKKSKLQHNKEIIANGLYMQAYVSQKEDVALQYIDSIHALYPENSYDHDYPAKAYILKSNIYMASFSLKNALDAILAAEKYATKNQNIEQQYLIRQQIGLVKIELGNYKEALQLALDNYHFFETDKSNPDFFFASWLLSDVYIRLNQPDDALKYINLALGKLSKSDKYYDYFLMYSGFCQSLKKNFTKSDSILKPIEKILENSGDNMNLAEYHYYLGENILQGAKNDPEAEIHFKKVDSILKVAKVNSLAFRKNYIRLIEIQKRKKDNDQLLYYLNRLIEIDENLNKNNVLLSETINDKYDTPHLLAEKEIVINKIKGEKSVFIILIAIIFVVLSYTVYYLIRIKKEKVLFEEKFNALIAISDHKKAEETQQIPLELQENTNKSIGVSEEIVNSILLQLAVFENEKAYLQLNLKAADLARQFNTNTTYLSNVINHYKNKNFSQYINELRIDFAVQKLKNDKNFRKYTVKAISEEVGFNNAESFAKAFNSKTGIQPSYFIKKLDDIGNGS